MSDVGNFFNSLPFFTRYWFALSIFFPLVARFGLLSPGYLVLEWSAFIQRFQIWRPITALFYFPLGPNTAFAYMLNLYFLYNYSIKLETGLFLNRPADYCFMLLFNWMTLVVAGLALSVWMLMEPMILSVLYLWCQINKDQIVNFWFGTRMKAIYLPWVLLGFNFILRGGGFEEFLGILVGHLYYFLTITYPQQYGGSALIQTPQILYDYFQLSPLLVQITVGVIRIFLHTIFFSESFSIITVMFPYYFKMLYSEKHFQYTMPNIIYHYPFLIYNTENKK